MNQEFVVHKIGEIFKHFSVLSRQISGFNEAAKNVNAFKSIGSTGVDSRFFSIDSGE
jgi:hypothetical protein